MTIPNRTMIYRPGRTLMWAGCITALTATLMAAVAMASKWEKETDTRDGIVVFSRDTPDTSVKEARAKMTVNVPPEVILQAAEDPHTFKGTTDKYVKKNNFYKSDNPNVWYNYQLVDFPVIAPRDYTIRYEKKHDPKKDIYRLEWRITKKHNPPRKDGVVRVKLSTGAISARPIRNGTASEVRYTIIADPGGNIPTWVIDLATRRSLPDIMREIRTAAKKLNK